MNISIVTPSFNQGQFLEQTILSIINQNYPDLEYIIIDGGSTDGSVDIIRKYGKHLKYWVSEKDRGQAHAINKGFALCTGNVLNWINADDRLLPDALQSLTKAVSSYPKAGAWAGSCNLVDKSGFFLEKVVPRGLTKDAIAAWGMKGHFFQPACFLSHRVWEEYGPLDEALICRFDLDFYCKMIQKYDIAGFSNVWTEATIHKDAKTQKHLQLMQSELALIQRRYGYDHLANSGIEESALAWIKKGFMRRSILKMCKLLRNYYNIKVKLNRVM